MIDAAYRIVVKKGRKAGASHPVPVGELSVGTTLDSQFFIGCVDMWHQLLRANSSADSRSATASGDALPEQLMKVRVVHDKNGLSLRVDAGFAEVGRRRLLPGDVGMVVADSIIRVGASEIMVQTVKTSSSDDTRAQQRARTTERNHAVARNNRWVTWSGHKAFAACLTAMAVGVLSIAILVSPPEGKPPWAGIDAHTQSGSLVEQVSTLVVDVMEQPVDVNEVTKPVSRHAPMINRDRIVVIVSSAPAFVMTESGHRYEVGEMVDEGFKISAIKTHAVELSRGDELRLLELVEL